MLAHRNCPGSLADRHPLRFAISLVIWGFGLVVQWLVLNTARFQTFHVQATDWLEGHGITVKSLLTDKYDARWVTGTVQHMLGHFGYAYGSARRDRGGHGLRKARFIQADCNSFVRTREQGNVNATQFFVCDVR